MFYYKINEVIRKKRARLYARIDICKVIEEKYGRIGIIVVRSINIYRTKLSKIKSDIDLLLTCKRSNLIPIFARMKLAVKVSFQLRNKISQQMIDAELKNKHRKKKIILNKIKKRQEELKSRVGYVTYIVFYHKINKVINNKKSDFMPELTYLNLLKRSMATLELK